MSVGSLDGVPLRSVSPGAKYPQAPAVPADVAPRPQTIVRRDTHVDSAFPQDRRVTPPVSAPASRARGFALRSGSADRLRLGLHPRPAPRSPIRRPGRGRLRAGVCREGRRLLARRPELDQALLREPAGTSPLVTRLTAPRVASSPP